MINSIQLGELNGNHVVGFEDSDQTKKAIDNENIFKKRIFKASEDEVALIKQQFKETYLECLIIYYDFDNLQGS